MQVKIAQYDCERRNKAAMEHFTYQLGFDVKKSSVSKWKNEVPSVNIGESAVVKCLPVKKR